MPRPGPRSSKQIIIATKRGTLGDTSHESTSSDDDSSVDRTPLKGNENVTAKVRRARHSQRIAGLGDSQFHTPEAENNATDYGFEFTTSGIQNPSPRRCSTFRTGSSQEEQLASAERKRGRKQQTAGSKETKEQNASRAAEKGNASKVVRKLTAGRGDDSDSVSEDEGSEENSDRLQEEELSNAGQSRGKKLQVNSGEGKSQKAKKDLSKQNASKGTKKQDNSKTKKKQDVSGDSVTEDEEAERREGDKSQRTLREDNTPTTTRQKIQGNSKKTKKSKQNHTQPTTKQSVAHEEQQQASTSTATKQISEGQRQPRTQAVAPKKSRKQKNPMQKERRFWREVNALQNRCDHLIPRLPFSRVIRELMMEASRHVTQITPTALEALQTAAEMYLTQRLQDAYMLTLHRGRVTLDTRDMELICFLKMTM